MVSKALFDPTATDEMVDYYENRIGPHIVAKIVATAWNNAAFKHRLLTEPLLVVSGNA
ncbi:nitrile hydratase subunit alpha [Hyphomicrobium sp. B1]|uniref:nitrile hydratase subunit alpha n=1 Tax=Hyphomicrobium sp. B1 TaxID=3075651 RepID=UPI003C30B0AC